jgi:hypothetical protein
LCGYFGLRNKRKGDEINMDWLAGLAWYWWAAIIGVIVYLMWYFGAE